MGYTSGLPAATGSPVQKTYKVRFTGVNGAAPTVHAADPGVTVTRTGEGVWDVLVPAPAAGLKNAHVTCSETGEFHELTHSWSTTTRKLTITHKACAYADIVTGPAADDVVAEVNVTITVEESDCIGAGI